MRGKAPAPKLSHLLRRITPAYAGKSITAACQSIQRKDHPRLCGEKILKDVAGLSYERITPAYAGKSFRGFFARFCRLGSPPPMRGKGTNWNDEMGFNGITPAYAGKSNAIHLPNLEFQDHPRLCGEKFPNSNGSKSNRGSPPPMRGKVQNLSKRIRTNRITPAYAGKSLTACGQA